MKSQDGMPAPFALRGFHDEEFGGSGFRHPALSRMASKAGRSSGAFLTTLLLLFLLPGVATAATRKIALNGLEIGLDENNGGIVSLSYPKVGGILETESASPGMRRIMGLTRCPCGAGAIT